MNKLLIVLLAVCLVSTHAFVKRDAPAAPSPSSDLEAKVAEVKTKLEDFGKSFGEQASQFFAPDNIKKGFNNMVDTVKQTYENFKPSSEAKPAANQ